MNTHTPVSRPHASTRAFSLVELVCATGICAMFVQAAISVTIQCLKAYATTVNQLSVNTDLRKFTEQMQTDAAYANDFYIYDAMPAQTSNAQGNATDNYLGAGQSGDLLLLMTTQTANDGTITASRLVAYYRNAPATTATSPGPIYRIDTGINNNINAPIGSIYTLYNTYIQPNLTNPSNLFMPTVVGTATNTDGSTQAHENLFFYLTSGSAGTGAFMVQSQIQERQDNGSAASLRTYNFALWPRG
jgi:hypothetical protein